MHPAKVNSSYCVYDIWYMTYKCGSDSQIIEIIELMKLYLVLTFQSNNGTFYE